MANGKAGSTPSQPLGNGLEEKAAQLNSGAVTPAKNQKLSDG